MWEQCSGQPFADLLIWLGSVGFAPFTTRALRVIRPTQHTVHLPHYTSHWTHYASCICISHSTPNVHLNDYDANRKDSLCFSEAHLHARYDGTYYLIRVFMVMGTFFFGLSLMNVFIAILAEAYIQAEEKKWKRFYRQRALIANCDVLQKLGAIALCRIVRRSAVRLIPPCLRQRLGIRDLPTRSPLPQPRAVGMRTASEKARSDKRRTFAAKSDAKHRHSSIVGETQSFLWVARPEHSKA